MDLDRNDDFENVDLDRNDDFEKSAYTIGEGLTVSDTESLFLNTFCRKSDLLSHCVYNRSIKFHGSTKSHEYRVSPRII